MESKDRSTRLRSSTLWVPGVVVVILGMSIHTHVAGLHGQARLVAGHAVACTLPVDLSGSSRGEAAFVPAVGRKFALSLVLRTPLAEDEGQDSPANGVVPDNAIAKSLKTAAFTVAWRLRSEGRSDIEGVISQNDLSSSVKGDAISYVFGGRQVRLKAGRSYRLTTEVTASCAALNEFAPALIVETSSPLKGHPLARWRLKDTGLLLFLGSSLIALGLSKRYSDWKKRMTRSATASVAGTVDDAP